MTRAEHLQWAKERALRYVEDGELHSAVASILSDLRKHPDTELAGQAMGGVGLYEAARGTRESVRKFIEGFQ
jgi:hypothetical protein